MKITKARPYIIGLLTALILELGVFNFSSLCSLFYAPADIRPFMSLENRDNEYELSVSGFEGDIGNLKFDVEVAKDSPVKYEIFLCDEGNYYEYALPEGTITKSSPSSYYTNIHSYGKVKSLRIRFTNADTSVKEPFIVRGIEINVRRPIMFNIWRFMAVYLIILFLGIFGNGKECRQIRLETNLKTKGGRLQLLIMICVMALWVVYALFMTDTHKLFNEASRPHQQQYKELAEALKNKEVALPYEASEGIKNAPNPYDTIYLQAQGIEYLYDYSYYNERYYVYFGIVPEILIYLPYHILTGKDFPNHAAVFVFYAVFIVGVFLLYRELVRKYFSNISYSIYLLMSSATVGAGSLAYIYGTADLYSVPIMAGLALTVLGLYFWLWTAGRMDIEAVSGKKRRSVAVLSFAGSLCMALVAGCRPQMVLFSLLAIPIFWDAVIKKRQLFSKKGMVRTILICIPYIMVAVPVMYYNYARFGSVFDFGATYSLTNNDMNLRGISLSRMLLGLFTFLFQPPYINGVFPFLQTVPLKYSYMGRMVTEHFFGGIMATNILTWPVVLLHHFRDTLRTKKLRAFSVMALVISIIIGMLDANQAGMLQRYTADMVLGILLAASILLFIILEKLPEFGRGFLKCGFLLGLGYSILCVLNTASGITMQYFNPELFAMFEELFRF